MWIIQHFLNGSKTCINLWKCFGIVLYAYVFFYNHSTFQTKLNETIPKTCPWFISAGEEPTGDVHYIANLIAGENLPGKNGSA